MNKLIKFAKFFQQLNVPIEHRAQVVAIYLGQLVAYSLSMPTSEVKSVAVYYHDQFQEQVNKVLDGAAEQLVFNYDAATRYVKYFYAFRYSMVYPTTATHIEKLVAVVSEMGVMNDELPGETSEILRKMDADVRRAITTELRNLLDEKQVVG